MAAVALLVHTTSRGLEALISRATFALASSYAPVACTACAHA